MGPDRCILSFYGGGGGEHRPWMFDDETLQIYKVLVAAHQELVLYLYTAGAQAYESGTSVIKPLDSTWQYTLGNSIFVSPITTNETKRLVSFPKGNDWMDFWNNSAIYKGGSQVTYNAPLIIYHPSVYTDRLYHSFTGDHE